MPISARRGQSLRPLVSLGELNSHSLWKRHLLQREAYRGQRGEAHTHWAHTHLNNDDASWTSLVFTFSGPVTFQKCTIGIISKAIVREEQLHRKQIDLVTINKPLPTVSGLLRLSLLTELFNKWNIFFHDVFQSPNRTRASKTRQANAIKQCNQASNRTWTGTWYCCLFSSGKLLIFFYLCVW